MVVRSRPHDSDKYREIARRLGYEGDTLALCQDHDPLHARLCDWLRLGDSPALRVAAGLDHVSEISQAEEAAVMSLQRFCRLAGVSLTTE